METGEKEKKRQAVPRGPELWLIHCVYTHRYIKTVILLSQSSLPFQAVTFTITSQAQTGLVCQINQQTKYPQNCTARCFRRFQLNGTSPEIRPCCPSHPVHILLLPPSSIESLSFVFSVAIFEQTSILFQYNFIWIVTADNWPGCCDPPIEPSVPKLQLVFKWPVGTGIWLEHTPNKYHWMCITLPRLHQLSTELWNYPGLNLRVQKPKFLPVSVCYISHSNRLCNPLRWPLDVLTVLVYSTNEYGNNQH